MPQLGEVVVLRDTANLSTGGEAIDRTDEMHPDNVAVAERAARAIGLDIAGIDVIAPDLTRPFRETGGAIIEVNAAPGFRMHLAPSQGQRVMSPGLRSTFFIRRVRPAASRSPPSPAPTASRQRCG